MRFPLSSTPTTCSPLTSSHPPAIDLHPPLPHTYLPPPNPQNCPLNTDTSPLCAQHGPCTNIGTSQVHTPPKALSATRDPDHPTPPDTMHPPLARTAHTPCDFSTPLSLPVGRNNPLPQSFANLAQPAAYLPHTRNRLSPL
ncbi:hypothetical protein BS47DRAFT_1400952 [Hydnum rufescens UP504]|uniref:Uncharacterized protein n=1 Tax=Hydnum rufescens UP504 TaxID=1448309 RepID=A0A9P6DNP1_9AGAM|nr:hypothetical protein BS47DRAFT_1400952 [Hydnum rufescens UP504]